MAESSTETRDQEAQAEGSGGDRKVPVAYLAKERAAARTARDEAEAAKQALAEQQANPTIDADFLKKLAENTGADLKKIVEAEVAAATQPYREKVARYELAVNLRLNEAQVDKVLEAKQKHPTLSNEEALIYARTQNPTMWPSAGTGPSPALPVAGASDPRGNSSDRQDFIALMRKAEKEKDYNAARDYAEQAFLQIARNTFLQSKGLPPQ